ncbi:TPA: hypothetical protein IGZ71_004720 [Escherichia coli]|nr:hypothetical protein [Escherichia coli]
MVDSDLFKKAEMISDRRVVMRRVWKKYGCTLTRAVTSERNIYQVVCCTPEDVLSFCLFEYFIITVRPVDIFTYSIIRYTVSTVRDDDSVIIADATVNENGIIDSVVDSGSHEQVLAHYLRLLYPLYDSLFQIIRSGRPLSLQEIHLSVSGESSRFSSGGGYADKTYQ